MFISIVPLALNQVNITLYSNSNVKCTSKDSCWTLIEAAQRQDLDQALVHLKLANEKIGTGTVIHM